ncbi:MAG: cytochrome c, partial [Cyanobacteria bacterium HKST-UBA02]|nr:cytochrome c [Cyanobacteria bacterium HKST-UBA02]
VSFSGRSIAAPSGESMYKKKCGFCHADGGNKMVPSKPVKGSKKLETKEIFKTFLSKKNGTMPAFTDIANNDEALTALHTYCKSLK